MKKLTITTIDQLSGNPIRLSSSYADGKLLTINPHSKVILEDPGEGYDQAWRFTPVGTNEFLISSSKNGDMICHYTKKEGEVSIFPLSENIEGCAWKVGKSGELYQKNSGGERYLWMVGDKLFVTQDSYLAENWIPLSDGKELDTTKSPKTQEFNYTPFVILFIIVVILLTWRAILQSRMLKQ